MQSVPLHGTRAKTNRNRIRIYLSVTIRSITREYDVIGNNRIPIDILVLDIKIRMCKCNIN